jgi:hypothetical protein
MEDKERQKSLHKDMTDAEEAYHSAYPNVRAPIMGAVITALLGRNGRGMLVWGIVGVIIAVIFWIGYSIWK